jgi:hypothetical protein
LYFRSGFIRWCLWLSPTVTKKVVGDILYVFVRPSARPSERASGVSSPQRSTWGVKYDEQEARRAVVTDRWTSAGHVEGCHGTHDHCSSRDTSVTSRFHRRYTYRVPGTGALAKLCYPASVLTWLYRCKISHKWGMLPLILPSKARPCQGARPCRARRVGT